MNLVEILKDCPKGTKLYTSVWGEVTFIGVNKNCAFPICIYTNTCTKVQLTKNGCFIISADSECILFPSKEQRDWSKFTAPWYKNKRFDPKILNSFDKVIARCSDFKWVCDMFSHYDKSKCVMPYVCVGGFYEVCIPYNNDTKHLVGTMDEAPEYYRYWED